MDIHDAASAGDLSAVRDAIKRGDDVNSVNEYWRTPLWQAASRGHTDCVRKLLSSGAVVDLADKNGDTPLWMAAYQGHTDCVRELLLYGAVVDLADEDRVTPLMTAAFRGREDTVKVLLSSEASIDITNKRGETALMMAKRSYRPNSSVIRLLKEATESHSVPVLPRLWTVVTDTETKKPVYHNKTAGETLSTPPGYPLHQTSAHPGVTFYGKPQEKEFTSSGGHTDFDNGLEVTVPANAVPAGTSVRIKVHPSLAPSDVFVIPEGIQSASPSYFISAEDLHQEVTLSMEHHVRVSTQEEAGDLVFLQADSSPQRSGSKIVYKYQEVLDGRSEFTPGGNKGRLTRRLSKKQFVKVGHQARVRGSFQLAGNQPDDPNVYTVRVYRSPSYTTGDRIAIIAVSLFGSLYTNFLETFDKVVIPQEYPEVSSKSIDRTIQGSLTFVDMCATLNIHPVQGWSVEPDKEMISRSEVDQPEMEKFRPENLHDYPPRIICRFFPEENAPKRTICTISLSGLLPQVEFYIPLKAPTFKVAVDTTKLQVEAWNVSTVARTVVDNSTLKEATEILRRTVGRMTTSQLGSTVEIVLSLMEKMTATLQSSSLSDLTAHTDSIRTDVRSICRLTRKVVKECNIGACLSKMEALSHQLCWLAKVKLGHCQDNAGYSVLVSCSEKIVQSLSEDLKALALHLLSAELITVSILEKTNELNETKRKKATRLYTALLRVINHHPHKYHEFVSTLKLNPLHTDLVREFDSKYMYFVNNLV